MAERAARGAEGERKVGAILEGLGPDWHVLHGVWLGHGDIDHVLVGPGGAFTIETEANRGRIPVDRIDERMLNQAYAESKLLAKVSGLEVHPLLVFSEAYLVGSAFVAILRDHYIRGPMKAKTYALDDLIVVVMRGSGFTPLEQTIMDSGEPDRVIAMREDFQRVMADRY
jgi:hypothetical protein